MAINVFGGAVASGDASKELGGTVKVSWNVTPSAPKFAVSAFEAGRYLLTLIGTGEGLQNTESISRFATITTYAGTAIQGHPGAIFSGGEATVTIELEEAADGIIIENFNGVAVLREWVNTGTALSYAHKPGDTWTFEGKGRLYSPTDAIMCRPLVTFDGTTERIYTMNERSETDSVFISTDGGRTWDRKFFIDELDVYPNNPFMYDDVNDKVWISTMEGIWLVSDDHFETPPTRVAMPSSGISRTITEYRELYNLGDGVFVSNISENNMLRSFDYGETWEEINGGLATPAWNTTNIRYTHGIVTSTSGTGEMYQVTESSQGFIMRMTNLKTEGEIPTQTNVQVDTSRSYYDVAQNSLYVTYTSNEGLVRITKSTGAIAETLAAPWAAHWFVEWSGSSWVFLPRARSTQHYIVINNDPLSTPLIRDMLDTVTEDNWACQYSVTNRAGEVIGIPWNDDIVSNPYDKIYDIKISDDDGLTFDNYIFEMGGQTSTDMRQMAMGGADGLTWIVAQDTGNFPGYISYDGGTNWELLTRKLPIAYKRKEGPNPGNGTTTSRNDLLRIGFVATDGNQKFIGTYFSNADTLGDRADNWWYTADGGVTFYEIPKISAIDPLMLGFGGGTGDAVWTGTRFIIHDYSTGRTWAFTPPANPADFSINDFVFLGDYGDGQFGIAFDGEKTVIVRTSESRVSIIREGSNNMEHYFYNLISRAWNGMAYGNGIFLIVSNGQTTTASNYSNGMRSFDGINWEPLSIPQYTANIGASVDSQIVFTGTHFVFRSYDWPWGYRSTDGLKWEMFRMPYAGTYGAAWVDNFNPSDVDLTHYPQRSSSIYGGLKVKNNKLYEFDQRGLYWTTGAVAALTA